MRPKCKVEPTHLSSLSLSLSLSLSSLQSWPKYLSLATKLTKICLSLSLSPTRPKFHRDRIQIMMPFSPNLHRTKMFSLSLSLSLSLSPTKLINTRPKFSFAHSFLWLQSKSHEIKIKGWNPHVCLPRTWISFYCLVFDTYIE